MEPTANPSPPAATPEPDPVPEQSAPPPPDPGISQVPPSTDNTPPPPPPFTASDSGDASPLPFPALPQEPAAPAQPIQPIQPIQPTQPTVVVGGGLAGAAPQVFTPSATVASAKPPGRKFSKKLLIPTIAVLVILIGAAAFYFGYYTSPSVIYSQSLSNTGKGYDKLVDYTNQQLKTDDKGYAGTGSYQIKASDASVDGNLGFKSGGGNTDTTFDIGAQGIRVSADIRTIKSSAATPDVYLKLSGIKGLGTLAGEPALDPELAKLDGNWIVIDHTLIDQLDSETSQSSSSSTSPTRAQLIDEAQAFGKVNQEYLFSTSKDKAVTKVVKNVGKETVDGHKTYHYQVSLQPANVKKYILAQRDALKASQMDSWLKKNDLESSAMSSFNDAADSTKDIKASDTYDVWMDTSHRIIYKVRFNDKQNPASNYVDVGLDYTGGSDYPFFISGKSDSDGTTSTYSFITDLNTKTDNVGFKLNAQDSGEDSTTGSASFNIKPNTSDVTIAKPANAIPVTQVLNDLGLSSDSTGSSSTAAAGTSLTTVLGNKLGGSASSGTVKTVQNVLLKSLVEQ